MSDTPESDKNAVEVSVDREFILVPAFCTLEFTRRLERERDQLREAIERAREIIADLASDLNTEQVRDLKAYLTNNQKKPLL
jgi:hypothetical protein